MKEVKERRKVQQWGSASPAERVRLARNRMTSQIFKVNNYNSLTSFQKKEIDQMINEA
jgi:hypothetical protein